MEIEQSKNINVVKRSVELAGFDYIADTKLKSDSK